MYELRIALEGLAARLATPCISQNVLEQLQKKFEKKSSRILLQADMELHELIIQSCGNQRLIDMLGTIHNLVQAFRVAGYTSQQRSADATADHLQLIHAMLNGDAEKAEAVMRNHIEKTKQDILLNIKISSE